MALCTALLVAFTPIPTASAAAPDGTYKFVKASGTLTLGGEALNLDEDMIRNIVGSTNGRVSVLQSQIKLNRTGAADMMKQIGESLGVNVEATISGPKALTLNKSGLSFIGKTTKPVVVNLKVSSGGLLITGFIRSNFKVVVQGRTMVMTVPVTGELLGKPLKGQVKATFRR